MELNKCLDFLFLALLLFKLDILESEYDGTDEDEYTSALGFSLLSLLLFLFDEDCLFFGYCRAGEVELEVERLGVVWVNASAVTVVAAPVLELSEDTGVRSLLDIARALFEPFEEYEDGEEGSSWLLCLLLWSLLMLLLWSLLVVSPLLMLVLEAFAANSS